MRTRKWLRKKLAWKMHDVLGIKEEKLKGKMPIPEEVFYYVLSLHKILKQVRDRESLEWHTKMTVNEFLDCFNYPNKEDLKDKKKKKKK